MRNNQIFVPTYNRKTFLALKLLEDPTVQLNVCVRPELDDTGFYDELKTIDRVTVIRLPYNLTDLGDTRQAILQYCFDNNIEWCCMFDDGVFEFKENGTTNTFEQLFNKCINRMKQDKLSEYIIGMNFRKRIAIDNNTGDALICQYPTVEHEYFDTVANQAVIINVFKAFEHNISYKSLKEVGFEDAAFFGDAIKAGLVFANGVNIRYSALIANQKKSGGSHNASESLQLKYYTQSLRCLQYLNMYGVRLENRFREHIGNYLTFVIFSYDYFREVLTEKREQNQKLIEARFAIENYEC